MSHMANFCPEVAYHVEIEAIHLAGQDVINWLSDLTIQLELTCTFPTVASPSHTKEEEEEREVT